MSNPERKYNDRNEAARLKESLERKGLMTPRRRKPKTPPVNCPNCKTGVLFDRTPGMALGLGVLHYKCDKCGCRLAYKVNP